ncbi:hypothetical protein ACXZ9C_10605 [Streptococcus agalactiae]
MVVVTASSSSSSWRRRRWSVVVHRRGRLSSLSVCRRSGLVFVELAR